MDNETFRAALAGFLGEERYWEFITTLNNIGRSRGWLTYAQEKVWTDFIAKHADAQRSFGELLAALRLCEVHRCEWVPETRELFHGHIDYSPRADEERSFCPHYWPGPVPTQGRSTEDKTVRVWVCPTCRSIFEQRMAVRETRRLQRRAESDLRARRRIETEADGYLAKRSSASLPRAIVTAVLQRKHCIPVDQVCPDCGETLTVEPDRGSNRVKCPCGRSDRTFHDL